MISYKARNRLTKITMHTMLIVASMTIIFPFLWILRTSFAYKVIAYRIPPEWFFFPTLDNYFMIFKSHPFHIFFLNSLVVALVSTVTCLIIGAPAAYSFARFRTGGNSVRVGVLTTQMLPAITLVIPFFLIFNKIGLYNSLPGLAMSYITFNIPFVVWILIGFFETLPKELDESAMIDGCTRLGSFLRITVPISLPGMLSAGVFCFVLSWNEFLFALILTGRASKTLPVAVAALITQQGTEIGAVCAATMLIVTPMILLYFCFRTFLIKGMVAGAIKG
ncbi:MAG: carbohydrate ABC transporter permease [Deltaproteobacteria bacterium]|nr:MAG: carbohydrate ABC transporter permease [Deltaproteobacteria bacterium]